MTNPAGCTPRSPRSCSTAVCSTSLTLLTPRSTHRFRRRTEKGEPPLRRARKRTLGEGASASSLSNRDPFTVRTQRSLCSGSTNPAISLLRLLYVLSGEANEVGFARIVRQMIVPFLGSCRQEATLDLDSFPHVVHGHQPGTAYNAHYHARCFHPLVASIDGRFFLGGRLRAGNVHTAEGGLDFVLPILRWLKTFIPRVWLRADAGFPAPHFLDTLEQEGVPYVCRLRSNAALDRLAAPFLTRPAGRPPAEGRTWLHELSYQAGSWSRPRRVVLVVLERPDEQQHLFLDHFFLLTSVSPQEESPEALLDRYRQRGTAESDFGAFKTTLHATLSSTPRPKAHYRASPVSGPYQEPDTFAANQAKLLLALLAANILAAGADLLSHDDTVRMSRERFRVLLLKTAARVLLSGRRVIVVIETARALLWQRFRAALLEIHPARGSPHPKALPTPA
ncbi:MAG TPA: IS1380 family transposase [Longimicrobiales bacterium]|nr:IS1380 family transposase [Longimicrobiales bacterium]